MTRLAIFIALLLLLYRCDAQAIEMADGKVSLSDSDAKTLATCREDNPCGVWSVEELRALLTAYHQRLISDGVTCRKGMI